MYVVVCMIDVWVWAIIIITGVWSTPPVYLASYLILISLLIKTLSHTVSLGLETGNNCITITNTNKFSFAHCQDVPVPRAKYPDFVFCCLYFVQTVLLAVFLYRSPVIYSYNIIGTQAFRRDSYLWFN